jgi:branched-chain amino acid transport system permease protein
VELLIERLLLGLQNGAIYASLALALVIVYRTNGLLNFAQGEMAMFSIFITWQFTDWGLGLVPAMLCAMVVSFVLAALIERLLVRPVGDVETNPLALVIVTIGLFLAINALAVFIWGTEGKNLPRLFPTRTFDLFGADVTATVLCVLAILAVEAAFLFFLFQRTKLGLGMRAVASTKESSSLVGIRVGWMLMAGWGLAAAIGTVAGVLRVETVSSLSFDSNTMQIVLIYAFAAATLGGFDSPVGAVIGGLIVGEVEILAANYIGWVGNDLALGVAFVLILVVLLVRPQGLFGSKQVIRV